MTLRKKPIENIVGKGENAGDIFHPIKNRNHNFSNI